VNATKTSASNRNQNQSAITRNERTGYALPGPQATGPESVYGQKNPASHSVQEVLVGSRLYVPRGHNSGDEFVVRHK